MERLNVNEDMWVQTFDETVPEGIAARHLYQKFGFEDYCKGEDTLTSIPTVIMKRPKKSNIIFSKKGFILL